jgi:hypothetical protein
LDREVLIYDLSENRAYCLNKTSAMVWQACDGTKNITEISQLISQKLKVSANEDLVWFALEQLKKEHLIENAADLPNHFDGLSRREVVKRVGLGTLVALPIVASLVAPTAVQAQTANCMTCFKFNSGDVCGPTCALVVGPCSENSGCGGGGLIGVITCAACFAQTTACMGGPMTCSWEQV